MRGARSPDEHPPREDDGRRGSNALAAAARLEPCRDAAVEPATLQAPSTAVHGDAADRDAKSVRIAWTAERQDLPVCLRRVVLLVADPCDRRPFQGVGQLQAQLGY